MSQMYFEKIPESKSKPVYCDYVYQDCALTFKSDSGVFSKGEIDFGTDALLKALPELSGNVLDLGCGFGAISVSIAKAYPSASVTASDVNQRALELTKENAQKNGVSVQTVESDGFEHIDGMFNWIITNPPIRTGKKVIYRLFEESMQHLRENGKLILVIRKQQGAQSAEAYLKTIFDSVYALDKSGGYWVICCEKGGNTHEV